MSNLNRSFFFAMLRLYGSETARYYREFLDVETRSPAQLQELHEQRLAAITSAAVRHSAFYRERVAAARFEEFPILTKQMVQTEFLGIMSDALRAEYRPSRKRGPGYSWIEVKTGGSTGAPTTVIHDGRFRDRGRASRLYSQYLCGFPFGTPYIRLWGSMREINNMTEALPQRIMRRLAGETLLNAFRMDDARMDGYLRLINASAIQHLMAYVDAACEIARRAKAGGLAMRPLNSIMACAGTVTPDARDLLATVFHSRVHNKYGSRDCADMACECAHGGLHVFTNQVHLEIVDDNGNAAPAGTTGRILVTLLGNESFPLVRYEIGDMGSWRSAPCPCGSPFPVLQHIEGRAIEFLTHADGGYVSPLAIIHLVGVVHNPGFIRRFQLVQETAIRFHLQCEVPDDLDPASFRKTTDALLVDLKATLGPAAEIAVSRTSRLPESASGKHLYTINRTRKTR